MQQRLETIKDASQRKEVAFRLKVIEFHNSFGTGAKVEAFGICRATIYRWKKLFYIQTEDTKEEMLREVPQEVIEFILNYRREHPRIGKEKFKPLVDRFCKGKGYSFGVSIYDWKDYKVFERKGGKLEERW
ncbi:MAG: hypothetical protein N3D14_03510 [Aquificaceae bacterium]|nr:hypothetical protein [Caldimicrobium sp.]MCX8164441.1 hypothetical protein [Aquificaceae bacterium]